MKIDLSHEGTYLHHDHVWSRVYSDVGSSCGIVACDIFRATGRCLIFNEPMQEHEHKPYSTLIATPFPTSAYDMLAL